MSFYVLSKAGDTFINVESFEYVYVADDDTIKAIAGSAWFASENTRTESVPKLRCKCSLAGCRQRAGCTGCRPMMKCGPPQNTLDPRHLTSLQPTAKSRPVTAGLNLNQERSNPYGRHYLYSYPAASSAPGQPPQGAGRPVRAVGQPQGKRCIPEFDGHSRPLPQQPGVHQQVR